MITGDALRNERAATREDVGFATRCCALHAARAQLRFVEMTIRVGEAVARVSRSRVGGAARLRAADSIRSKRLRQARGSPAAPEARNARLYGLFAGIRRGVARVAVERVNCRVTPLMPADACPMIPRGGAKGESQRLGAVDSLHDAQLRELSERRTFRGCLHRRQERTARRGT